jgi:hypothetical protein
MKSILIDVIICFLGTIFFVCLFNLPILKQSIFFYKGIFFIALSTLLVGGLVLFCNRAEADFKEVFLISLAFACFTLSWFTLLPTTVERSISVYMLSYMEASEEQAISNEKMENVFIEKYVKNHKAIDKRIQEQEISGNIEKTADGYRITTQGKFLVKLFRLTTDLFNTQDWVVNDR